MPAHCIPTAIYLPLDAFPSLACSSGSADIEMLSTVGILAQERAEELQQELSDAAGGSHDKKSDDPLAVLRRQSQTG